MLEAHGPKGKTRIGKKMTDLDSWRDDPEDIEMSHGSDLHDKISFEDKTLRPAHWHTHPTLPGSMLCASDPQMTQNHSCLSLDLENSGKTVMHYLGHGGAVDGFSTSEFHLSLRVVTDSPGFMTFDIHYQH